MDAPETIAIARLRKRHRSVLVVCTLVTLLAFAMTVNDGQSVALSPLAWLPVPELCASRAWFGVSCPGCGLTRSFIYLADGEVAKSVAMHRVGWVLAAIVLLNIPYRIVCLRQDPVGGQHSRWPRWIGTALITLLIANWVANEVMAVL